MHDRYDQGTNDSTKPVTGVKTGAGLVMLDTGSYTVKQHIRCHAGIRSHSMMNRIPAASRKFLRCYKTLQFGTLRHAVSITDLHCSLTIAINRNEQRAMQDEENSPSTCHTLWTYYIYAVRHRSNIRKPGLCFSVHLHNCSNSTQGNVQPEIVIDSSAPGSRNGELPQRHQGK